MKRGDVMEAKCPVWSVCGAAMVHHYWAQQIFPYGDERRDWIGIVCSNENGYKECPHYELRVKKEAKKMNELKREQNCGEGAEEIVLTKIVVSDPYTFDIDSKILRRKGLIVKNSWCSNNPSQEEIGEAIGAIEAAIELLKLKEIK